MAKNIDVEFESSKTWANKASDRITEFVGSWPFIFIFFIFLGAWMLLNSAQYLFKPFDLYPFILLNLILSCVAAIQAPIIVMSQNRQAKKDSVRAEHDFKVDMKAEIEIRHLNSKIDQLLSTQWERLLEIQEIQMELMQDNLKNKRV